MQTGGCTNRLPSSRGGLEQSKTGRGEGMEDMVKMTTVVAPE